MDLGPWEIAIIAVVILVLFGSKKLPDAARSLGRSLRILKTEVKGLHDDDDEKPTAATPPPAELSAGQSAVAVPPASTTTTAAGDRPDLR